MVWVESTNVQRTVAIYLKDTEDDKELESTSPPVFTPCVPVLFHVCKESREVAFNAYPLIEYHDTGAIESKSGSGRCQLGPMYFNFAHDVYLGCALEPDPAVKYNYCYLDAEFSIPQLLPKDFLTRLRHLAIKPKVAFEKMRDTWGVPLSLSASEYYYQCIKHFEVLETLYLVMEYYADSRAQLPVLLDGPSDEWFFNVYVRDIREAQKAHPDWKAPEIRCAHLDWI